MVLGDNGHATFNTAGILTFITTISPGIGGDDSISVGNGDNIILGGEGRDTITGGADRDVILGDNGNATFSNSGILLDIISTDTSIGGNDIITAGSGLNIILGGFGADDMTGGSDRDVVLGDNGHAIFNTAGDLTFITTISPEIGGDDLITVGNGNNFVFGGVGKDTITGGDDRDVILGDNGNATFDETGILTFITTSEPAIGGDDIIDAGDGLNIIIGGIGSDQITGGTGRDIVVGDNGNATFDDTGVLILIKTTDAKVVGNYNDFITLGRGNNLVLAGNGDDIVVATSGHDVIVGDNGRAIFDNLAGESHVSDVISTDTAIGGHDILDAGTGNNVIIGGFGNDYIFADSGSDFATGDSGHVIFNPAGLISFIETISPALGDNDLIYLGAGNNVSFGGFGSDEIISLGGDDLIFGDNGNAAFSETGILIYLTTSQPNIGGNDTIDAGNGTNIILGGFGADLINGGYHRDFILGDNGNATFNTSGVLTYLTTTQPGIGGNDRIGAGNGSNVVFGGAGADTIIGGSNRDVILGDNGHGTFNFAGDLIHFVTTQSGIGSDDLIFGGDGSNFMFGGFGADVITGGKNRDFILGDNGFAFFDEASVITILSTDQPAFGNDDLIAAGAGNDVVFGGKGRDTIAAGSGRDVIVGDNGLATFDPSWTMTFLTTNNRESGDDDTILGESGSDLIFGGGGNDTIDGGNGDDTIVGDLGDYNIDSSNPRGVTLFREANGGNDIIDGSAGDDLILSGGGDDNSDGGSGSDTVFAGYGNDLAYGGTGDDILIGGPNGDFLDGGFDNDTLYVDVFDTWAGGMFEDTIVGGPFFSTGLTYINGPIYHFGDTLASSAADIFGQAFDRLTQRMDGGVGELYWNLANLELSDILDSSVLESLMDRGFDNIRWGGVGGAILALAARELATPARLSQGGILERQWSELLALAN